MDVPHVNPEPKTCIKHNQPILLIDPDPKKGAFCLFCIQQMTELISPNQLLNQQQELIDQSNQECKKNQQQLQNLLNELLNYQQNINLSLNKIIQVIKNQIESIDSFTKQIQSLNSQSMAIDELKQICQNQQKNNIQGRSEVRLQLKRYQTEYDTIVKLLDVLDDSQQKSELKNNSKTKLQYELLTDSSIKESEYCRSFAFNKEGDKLLVACGKQIIVYEFINGKMTEKLQRLTNHTENVNCLYFMKQSNSFVSGSRDHSIIIWELNKNNTYQSTICLIDHKDDVMCILMNKSEDLLISGSYDNTVKFRIKIDNKWNLKQTIDTKQQVDSISLNKYENKLISCGRDSPISIIQLQNDNTWSIVQTIQVCEWGLRLTFVERNQFIFQPLTKDFIELYDFDEILKQFQKLKEIKVQSCLDCTQLFPCQSTQQFNILIVKHGQFLNIFSIYEGNQKIYQTLEFQSRDIFGKLSDDGRYLATWDYRSNEIQIRERHYYRQKSNFLKQFEQILFDYA